MKILLFGSNGQLGKTISERINPKHQIIKSNRNKFNLEDINNITNYIQEVNPDLIINASAYTAVDEAENNKNLSFLINCEAVEKIALEAKKKNIFLIHYSTDYVFDGQKINPYNENDETKPINTYGESKLAGEKKIEKISEKYIIFRTSWVIGRHGKNFVKTILRLSNEKKHLNIVNDQYGVPTSTNLISAITNDIVENINQSTQTTSGIFHLCPKGKTTWFEITKKIIYFASFYDECFPLSSENILPIPTKEMKLKARRPKNSSLNTNKLQKFLGYNFPYWEDDFKIVANEIMKDFYKNE